MKYQITMERYVSTENERNLIRERCNKEMRYGRKVKKMNFVDTILEMKMKILMFQHER